MFEFQLKWNMNGRMKSEQNMNVNEWGSCTVDVQRYQNERKLQMKYIDKK